MLRAHRGEEEEEEEEEEEDWEEVRRKRRRRRLEFWLLRRGFIVQGDGERGTELEPMEK